MRRPRGPLLISACSQPGVKALLLASTIGARSWVRALLLATGLYTPFCGPALRGFRIWACCRAGIRAKLLASIITVRSWVTLTLRVLQQISKPTLSYGQAGRACRS